MSRSLLLALVVQGLIAACTANYNLKNAWYGGDIISNFSYFTGADPTNGYVYYASQQQAASWGYTFVKNNQAWIKSDNTAVASGSGRGSVRLQSYQTYTKGLFIFDVVHMPWGMGTWPAIWTTEGTNWPAGGEIDILEGVNDNNGNQMTLHTSPGCTVPTAKNNETGNPETGDCGAASGHTGCGISDPDTWSYGNDFNNNQGGVWAMQWEDSGVYIWLWSRNYIPSDIKNNQPNPASWPAPRGRFTFNQGCTGSQYFYNHGIIIDNTFCGDWAGAVYPGGSSACVQFVQNNPSAFDDAYWVFNYIQVYQQ
jgi:hypothetical protein